MVLNIEWMQFVLKNCEILYFVRRLYDKNSASQYSFFSDVVYKKNKRLVCRQPDLLARICKLVECKKFGLICFQRICFARLIYCDQEPSLLLNVTEDYFLGVHIRLYQRDTKFVSLQNHLAFPSKVTWMCPYFNWFVEYKIIVSFKL